MIFDVRWEESALNELASIWLQADSSTRQAITAATHLIDQQLQVAPFDQGESRAEGRRIHFAFPLGLTFTIDTELNLVSVLHIWQFHRHGK